MKNEKIYAITSFETSQDGDDETNPQSTIVQRLQESNTIITYLIGETQVALTDPNADVLHMQFGTARVNKLGRMNFYPGPQTPQIVMETLTELKFMIDVNNGAIAALEGNLPIRDVVTYNVSRDTNDKVPVFVHKIVIDDPPICPQCGDAIVYDSMADHVVSSSCLSQKTKMIEDASGWQLLDAEHEAVLNRTKNVPHKMVASSYDMWTPKWVQQAIEFYERNKGYAGLTLEEYLDKMADHQTK